MNPRAIRIAAQGGPDVMKLESISLPEPAAGEALVRQTVAGINYLDVYHRCGIYPLPLPTGIGSEAAGVVERVGAGVTEVEPGDRVAYVHNVPGAYASHRVMPAARLVKLPDHVSEETAGAVMLKGMTVEYLLNRTYPVRPGDFVLFWAAAGGVGLLAGRWGKHLGARMIGVAGGADKCRLAREYGYDDVIDRTREDVAERVKAITGGKGVPVVYDSVGKASFEASLASLRPRGYFVSFGTTTGAPPPVEAATLQKRGSLYFTRPTLFTYISTRDELLASAGALFDLLDRGALTVRIGARYPLAEAARAHGDLEAGRTVGSSLLIP
ncbi:MAG: quinone oxidoreductase [Acidobacteria bacterium RIFCSPLOWO2_02_FULL_68_18]|nr:MAG: quinone oxidoreductase [Acidobacteria bacterium RIFCSPLOWO2_02_FULL_68_18]OFW49216.1 MAG: quinone oxidoreductase [Acidobacteria bacterium RIFCSPLOWO2_12_FULL_68_19]